MRGRDRNRRSPLATATSNSRWARPARSGWPVSATATTARRTRPSISRSGSTAPARPPSSKMELRLFPVPQGEPGCHRPLFHLDDQHGRQPPRCFHRQGPGGPADGRTVSSGRGSPTRGPQWCRGFLSRRQSQFVDSKRLNAVQTPDPACAPALDRRAVSRSASISHSSYCAWGPSAYAR